MHAGRTRAITIMCLDNNHWVHVTVLPGCLSIPLVTDGHYKWASLDIHHSCSTLFGNSAPVLLFTCRNYYFKFYCTSIIMLDAHLDNFTLTLIIKNRRRVTLIMKEILPKMISRNLMFPHYTRKYISCCVLWLLTFASISGHYAPDARPECINMANNCSSKE